MQCLFCESSQAKEIFLDGEISVRRCLGCGHVFSSYPGEENFSEYFSEDILSENHFWWHEAHARMYRVFRKKFLSGRSGNLLDVGCGLGYFLASLRDDQACVNWSSVGVEMSRSANEFAKKNLGLNNIFQGTVAAAAYPDNHFQVVTLWDVIEHLPNPRPILLEIKRIMMVGGVLFLATPNINVQLPKARLKKLLSGQKSGHYLEARDHLHDYSPRTLRWLLEESGFKKVSFLQLPPITSVSGRRSRVLAVLKEGWHQVAKVLFVLSLGRLNLNNLYVVAYK